MVSDMKKFLKIATAVALLGLGLVTPSFAQSASEMAVRMQQLEEQVRMLMGQGCPPPTMPPHGPKC